MIEGIFGPQLLFALFSLAIWAIGLWLAFDFVRAVMRISTSLEKIANTLVKRDSYQAGSYQAGSDQAGSDQAGSDQAGSDQAGSDQAGSDQV